MHKNIIPNSKINFNELNFKNDKVVIFKYEKERISYEIKCEISSDNLYCRCLNLLNGSSIFSIKDEKLEFIDFTIDLNYLIFLERSIKIYKRHFLKI